MAAGRCGASKISLLGQLDEGDVLFPLFMIKLLNRMNWTTMCCEHVPVNRVVDMYLYLQEGKNLYSHDEKQIESTRGGKEPAERIK